MRKLNAFALAFTLTLASAPLYFRAYSENASRQDYLLVVNRGDKTLALLDPQSAKFVATIPLTGITGHEVAVSHDGTTAFVPIYGNSAVGAPGTDGSTIDVIDLASRKVRTVIDLEHGSRPHCPVLDPTGKLLYVTTELDNAITEIDVQTLKVIGQIPTGSPQSHMLAITGDGAVGYTANVGPGTMSVLDMKKHTTTAVLPIATNVQRVSLSKDEKFVFTSEALGMRLAVIDAKSHKVAHWVQLPAPGYGTASTKDGRWLLVAHRSAAKLSVVDLKTFTVARTLVMPQGPSGILVRPDGRVAYISCDSGNKIAILNLSTWNVEKEADAGNGADGLAWASVGQGR